MRQLNEYGQRNQVKHRFGVKIWLTEAEWVSFCRPSYPLQVSQFDLPNSGYWRLPRNTPSGEEAAE
jgi:hypothetical protein